MKRRLDDVERENAIFHDLVKNIQDGDDVQVAKTVAIVRSRASLVEIQLYLIRMADRASFEQREGTPGEEGTLAATGGSSQDTE